MMEENKDSFFAGGDALVHSAGPMHQNIPQRLFGATHLVRTYLRTFFSTPFPITLIRHNKLN